jgi:hypothetical protein
MAKKAKNRYDFDSLPISELTRKSLSKENIDQLGTIGRMLSLQDDAYDEMFEEVIGLLREQSKEMTLRFDAIDKKFDIIEARLDKMEQGATEREIRLSILEKHNSLPQTTLRYSILLIIGMLLGWALHTLI